MTSLLPGLPLHPRPTVPRRENQKSPAFLSCPCDTRAAGGQHHVQTSLLGAFWSLVKEELEGKQMTD